MGEAERHLKRLIEDSDWVSWFENKLVRRGDCLIWTGSQDNTGYGRIHVKKHCERPTGRNFFAHRAAYAIQTGEILEPHELILHQCHTRLCCNSDCFEIGDHRDNMDDLRNSGNIAGERNPKSKLTEYDVWDILCMYYEGGEHGPYSINSIVNEYSNLDIKKGTVSDIVYGRTWKSVYDEFFEVEA